MADAVIDLPENDPAIDRAVKIIEENLIKEMPDCHVTSLHENDAGYAPLLQKYEDKGLETLIIDMDFYVEEDAEPGVFTRELHMKVIVGCLHVKVKTTHGL